MITKEKLTMFKYYNGDIDAFGHGPKRDKKVISENEFHVIDNLIQDIRLVQKGLAGNEYETELNKRLEESCDTSETIDYLKKFSTDNK
jgi:hypothetical protein